MGSTYKVLELVATSPESWGDAARSAVETAGKSVRNLRNAQVEQLDIVLADAPVRISDPSVRAVLYRARVSVSFKVEDPI